jgi:transposase-like protein
MFLPEPTMPTNEAEPIHLSERERRDLQALVRQQTCPQHLVLRARIVLLADQDIGIRPSAEGLGVARTTVRNWRRRWLATKGARVAERLADAPRPGAPALYSAEDACAIIALACEDPRASNRAMTHWTQRELADEGAAVLRSCLRSLKADENPSQSGTFLSGSRAKLESGISGCDRAGCLE